MDQRERAISILSIVDEGEINSWMNHPCTRYFKLSLRADLDEMKELWCTGAYTADGDSMNTIQLNAEAVGKAGAVQDILDTIEGLVDEKRRNEEEAASDSGWVHDFS